MSEYEELRKDLELVTIAVAGYTGAVNRHGEATDRQIEKLWDESATLRDELHAVANRLENLTRAVTTSPAEVAAAIVNDANRSTLREVRRDECLVSTYYYVCDECGSFVTITGDPIPEGESWECDECGNDAAWEFTDKRAAFEHGAHIQRGKASGLFRNLS